MDALPGTVPAVFGRSVDVHTGLAVDFAFDPHIMLYENTVDNPLPDGGGQVAIDTHDPITGQQVMCSNAKRNHLNEDGCKLSYLETACKFDEDPKEIIILDDTNLAGISTDTGKVLAVISGLVISDVLDDKTGLNAPCAVTLASQFSRWIRDDADSVCANTASI